jgi:hypothetical protein
MATGTIAPSRGEAGPGRSGSPARPVCIVCDGAGCEFCPGTFLARSIAACLDGRPEAPIPIGLQTFVRAEVVVRSLAPEALENLEARRRLRDDGYRAAVVELVAPYTGSAA